MQPSSKPTNPKDALGIKKAPSSTVSQAVMTEVGLGMMEGGLKYGRHNYRAVGVRASVYYDATRRHLDRWWEGQDIDKASKLSHIAKAIASLTVLRDAMIQDMWEDDRPPKSKVDWDALDARAAELLEELGHIQPKHITELGQRAEESQMLYKVMFGVCDTATEGLSRAECAAQWEKKRIENYQRDLVELPSSMLETRYFGVNRERNPWTTVEDSEGGQID